MSQEATVTGVVHLIEETKTFGQRGFRKRVVVLEDDSGRFTQYIPVEFIQDACDSVDELSVGDQVRIRYKLGGRRWQRDPDSEVKYFLSAEATGFERVEGGNPAPQESTEYDESEAPFEDDDIPF